MIDTANAKTNTRLDDEQLDRLVDQMFVLAGMDGKSSLKFDDFKKLFYKNGDLLQDVSLDWKGEELTESVPRARKGVTSSQRTRKESVKQSTNTEYRTGLQTVN